MATAPVFLAQREDSWTVEPGRLRQGVSKELSVNTIGLTKHAYPFVSPVPNSGGTELHHPSH